MWIKLKNKLINLSFWDNKVYNYDEQHNKKYIFKLN